MADLYKILLGLCEKKGISGYRMCRDLHIQPSIMTDLKYGRRHGLTAGTASRIADYFGVSVSFLLGETTEEKENELSEYLEQLKNREEMRMLFSLTKNASKEDVEKTVRIIEALRNS
ncbi:MAG: helix-turn-helix domain-containing protein [Oscillospiraceae bacterium]